MNKENIEKHQFKKGYDPKRNLKGRTPMPSLKDVVAKALSEETDTGTVIELIVKTLASLSRDGNIPAAKELFDRGFGKAGQTIEQTNIEQKPLRIIVEDEETAELVDKLANQ